MKRFLLASLVLVVSLSTVSQASAPTSCPEHLCIDVNTCAPCHPTAPTRPVANRPGTCAHTYTVASARHAARVVYRGTRKVSHRDQAELSHIVKCLRNPRAKPYVRWYIAHQRRLWRLRCHPPVPPLNGPVTASWFDDSGATACGIHATYGFATLNGTPCGATVLMRGPSGVVVRAVREDSGPYVGGRMFDLNPALKAALGCGDLCEVYYR